VEIVGYDFCVPFFVTEILATFEANERALSILKFSEMA